MKRQNLTETLRVRIDRSTRRQIVRAAKREGVSDSRIVRRILRAHFEQEQS